MAENVSSSVPENQPSANSAPVLQGKYSPAARRKRRRNLIIAVVVLVLIVASLLLWRYLSSYESTDDAQVDVHLYPVSARISGYVIRVNVNDNQWVEKGDVLVEIDPTDYQVALAQAQANLANAEATARSLNITVPITSVNSTSQLQFTASGVEDARAAITAAQKQLAKVEAQLMETERRLRQAEMRAIDADNAMKKLDEAVRARIDVITKELTKKFASAA